MRLLGRGLPSIVGAVLISAAQLAFAFDDQSVNIGLIVNLDGKSVSVFDQLPPRVRAVVNLPSDSTPIAGGICELSDRSIVGVITDLGGYVHLIDVLGGRYVTQVPVSVNVVDVSCCGDYAILTSGAFLSERQPIVMDLRTRLEVPQSDPSLPVGMANACSPDKDHVLLSSTEENAIHLLGFNRSSGQLSNTGARLAASGPVDVEFAPDGTCGTALEDAAGEVTGFRLPTLVSANSSPVPLALSLLDSCFSGERLMVRSTSMGGFLDAYDVDRNCRVSRDPTSASAVGGLVLGQFPGVDNIACAQNGMIYVTVDGGDAGPGGDSVQVYTSLGGLVGTLRDPSINGPLGIATFNRNVASVPALSPMGLSIIAVGMVLCLALGRGAYGSNRRGPSSNRACRHGERVASVTSAHV
jgi:sugar lactone lactonase YvrE